MDSTGMASEDPSFPQRAGLVTVYPTAEAVKRLVLELTDDFLRSRLQYFKRCRTGVAVISLGRR
jgi:hypothetical protein